MESGKPLLMRGKGEKYLYLPQHFKENYEFIQSEMSKYQSIEKPTIDDYTKMMEEIINMNGLKKGKLEFQPVQIYLERTKSEIEFLELIKFVIEQSQKVQDVFADERIKILTFDSNDSLTFTDQQALALICNQLMCTFPQTYMQDDISKYRLDMPSDFCFHKILTSDKTEDKSKIEIKATKIEFLMSYFKKEQASQKTQLTQDEHITIERLVLSEKQNIEMSEKFWATNSDKLNPDMIQIDNDILVEDHQDTVIADFANKYIGGGSIRAGAVQEEILFLIFPQLFISIMLCERMNPNESILLHNFKRYFNYSGYSNSLEFKGYYDKEERRDIVAMDAINYSQKENSQYEVKNLIRDLNKCYVAFRLSPNCKHTIISTGKWGCGAFKGNFENKFLQQWMVASLLNRKIIFNTFHDEKFAAKANELIDCYSGQPIGKIFDFLKQKWKKRGFK